jgi:general secretion pathway protein I
VPVRRRHDARGFTLLEVMVALAVIAIAFTALLGLHARNLRIVARQQAYTQALLLARTLITQVELLPGLPEVGYTEGDFEGAYPGLYPGFRWYQQVNEPQLPIPDTREVNVRVVPNGDEAAAAELTTFKRQRQQS